jgi:AbrB family looped-hinge helix DNA binding protein
MNAKVNIGGVITLPADVVEELELKPGSEVAFTRSQGGEIVLTKAPEPAVPSREQIRDRIRAAARSARTGVSKEFVGMTTDEFMEFIRG